MLENVIIWVCGVLVGVVVSRLFPSGILKIDQTDSEKDIYRLEINNLDVLPKRRTVVLKVDAHADLSQN